MVRKKARLRNHILFLTWYLPTANEVLGQGNVFTGVCPQEVWLPSMHHRSHDWGVCMQGWWVCIQGQGVCMELGKPVVRILLECFLVKYVSNSRNTVKSSFCFISVCYKTQALSNWFFVSSTGYPDGLASTQVHFLICFPLDDSLVLCWRYHAIKYYLGLWM